MCIPKALNDVLNISISDKMRRIEFHSTRWLAKLRDHLVKNKSCDLSTRSIDLYQYFLKMASSTANKQLEGIKIDKYDMFSGCIVFYDDQLINQVIVAFDDTDVDELARRVGL